MVGNAMDGAGSGKASLRGSVAALRRRTVEALVLAQANADGERRKRQIENEKVKNSI